MGLIGDIWNGVVSSASLAYEISKDQQLTGAQREANQFTHTENALARDFNAQQARQQMDFQERMSNTQYQRAVADMQAAGVNPALAMSQGGNVSPNGASATSGAGSSVDPGRGMTMSDILSALRYRKEIALLDKQAENIAADTAQKNASTSKTVTETSWLGKIYASEIGLREVEVNKYAAEIESILASAEGQRILNEWNPKLFESQLENDKVNRSHTIAGIAKLQQDIDFLIAQEVNTYADTDLKRFQQGLVAAQTSLAAMQERDVSASAWRKEWENSFTELTGVKPDEPLWNAVTSVLAESGVKIRDVVQHPGKYINNAVKRWRDSR